jgi:serine/threonine protein kinase
VSRETDQDLPGTSGRIAGYRLDGYIGRGDAAVVYLAQDERLDRKVALKVLTPELAGDAAFRIRFLREARSASAVGDPHIIPVYEAGEASGIVYLAMRYVQGGDARSLLSRLGPLPFAWAWSIIAQVASALDAAHAHGLIHRDVKPASMLLDTSSAAGGRTPGRAGGSDFGHVYLSDFGMSKNSPPGDTTAAGQFAGTLDYVAPEQIQGRVLDGRADLYSLACAGFELLCGTPPFGQDQGLTVMYEQLYAPPPAAAAWRPDLPAAVDLVLARALAKSPADRYATCGQFAEELRTALGLLPGEPGHPARLGSPGHGGPAAAVRPASGEQGTGKQHESGPEPTQAPAPAQSGVSWPQSGVSWPQSAVSWPQSPEGQPAVGPGPVSADSMSGPGGPAPQQLRRRPGVISLILAVAAVAIAAAAVAVGVAHSNRPAPGTPAISSPVASSAPSSSSASTLATRQAAAVNNLLDSSAATRKALHGAVNQVSNCTNLSTAVSQIRSAVNQRSSENNQASALSTAALASGARVKSDLIAALRNSLDADRDYLTWAQQQLYSGCTPSGQSSAYEAAHNADQQADASKEAFVQVWNQVAAQYGVQQKSPGSI